MSLLPTQKVNSLAVPSWLLCAWSIWFYTPHASHSICFGIDNSEIRRQNLWKYIVNCEVPWSVSFQRNHWITGNPEWINGKSLHPVSSDIYFYTKTHAKHIAPGHVTPVGCCFHIHTHTHTSELIVRIDFFKNQRRRGDVTVLYHACVCVCDMRMCPSQQFAQFIQTAALYQRVCGGAPAAWCWAKSSSRLMWVTPAATGLRFIYLGKETGTQETQEDSDLTLKAANITENIKLLCYFSVFKWKLDDLSSHAFYPDTSLSVLCCPGFLC